MCAHPFRWSVSSFAGECLEVEGRRGESRAFLRRQANRWWLFLLPAAHCLLPLVPARADIQQPPRAHAPGERQLQRRGVVPATATAQVVQVEVGDRVQIILQGEGPAGKSLDFAVRKSPQHGTILGDPSRLTRNSVAVFYVPTPGDDATEDEFTFTAQATGGAVSAPETVRLRLLPPPPVLAVTPAELDFGLVKAGESAQAEFTLENQGGGEASGRVDPPAPFAVDGPAEYHLARGARQTFRIVFRPTMDQVFNDALHFRFETGAGVELVGTGLAAPGQPLVARTNQPTGDPAAPGDGLPGSGNGALTIYPVVTVSQPSAGTTSPGKIVGTALQPAGGGRLALDRGGTGNNPALVPGSTDDTAIPVNDAMVTTVQVNGVGRSTVDLTWKPPVPKPASYRVEVRYILVDDDQARVDWRPYAQVEISAARDRVTTHVRGLPPGGLQMLRIVAVDGSGRLAAPSPMVTVMMQQPSTWWQPTLLKALVLLLAICVGLVARRKWEERQMLAEIDESRRRASVATGVAGRA